MPWFLDSEQKVRGIERHPLNGRQHNGVKQQYVASVRLRGVIENVRGECWLTEASIDSSGRRSGPKLALTFGSLSEAFYSALQDDASNPALVATLSRGLEARLVSHRTPESVLKFLIRYHNGFHFGASTSFLELIGLIPEACNREREQERDRETDRQTDRQRRNDTDDHVLRKVETALTAWKTQTGLTWQNKEYESKCISAVLVLLDQMDLPVHVTVVGMSIQAA